MGFFDGKIEGDLPKDGSFSGPSFEIIPAGTQCLAFVEDALIEHGNEGQFIQLRWRILKPEAIANRVIFQKVRIWDQDGKKRNRALMMLAAIDQNAGGIISGQADDPTDALLARALPNKPMLIKLDVWEIDGKSGNWICAVAPKPTGDLVLPEVKPSASPVMDSDIPF